MWMVRFGFIEKGMQLYKTEVAGEKEKENGRFERQVGSVEQC